MDKEKVLMGMYNILMDRVDGKNNCKDYNDDCENCPFLIFCTIDNIKEANGDWKV